MTFGADIFGPGANFKNRFIEDYDRLAEITNSLKKLNLKSVLVTGTFDLTHIGHARYLERAKERGAVVIVGVDPDAAVKIRKGPRRPVVPHKERLEMLSHLRHVDLVTLTNDYDEKGISGYDLIKTIRPDIFVISEMNKYTQRQLQSIKKYASELVILPVQAETTTSAKIRLLTMDVVENLKKDLNKFLSGL
jgi:cytidyltransferase-like protein